MHDIFMLSLDSGLLWYQKKVKWVCVTMGPSDNIGVQSAV